MPEARRGRLQCFERRAVVRETLECCDRLVDRTHDHPDAVRAHALRERSLVGHDDRNPGAERFGERIREGFRPRRQEDDEIDRRRRELLEDILAPVPSVQHEARAEPELA